MQRSERKKRILEAARIQFGDKAVEVETPGGSGRASYRLNIEGRSVIATLRPNFRRTHLEAHVLSRLSPICDLVPECLGVVDEVMFQSDLGGKRLNLEIALRSGQSLLDLAGESIQTIFAVQSAGRQVGLPESLPHLGNNRMWVENLVFSAKAMADFSEGRSLKLNFDEICEHIDVTPTQFLKWDCRSGNAAIGHDGQLRWFDFEYCGVRHGAEDLAWLIGDEAWPVAPEDMEQLVRQAFDPRCGHTLDDYIRYLALYTSFHCVQRLKLITKEARKRGWLSKAKVRKYDDAGVHPEFAAQICKVGAYFASMNALTMDLSKDFEDAQKVFEGILMDGLRSLSA